MSETRTTQGAALSAMQTAAIQAAAAVAAGREYASSAKAAHRDAVVVYARGDYANARRRALNSLAYSVGRFSRIYQDAKGAK